MGHLTRVTKAACGALAATAALTWANASFAQGPDVPVVESRSYAGPNRALLGTGIVTFGLAYIPAVVVAGESNQPADHHMFVPVVGPWLNLGNRPDCGVGNVSCDNETTNKVLIAADGVFQGLGVLAVVGSFLSPEHDQVVTRTASREPEKPSLHFAPAQMGSGGYGLRAFGKF